MTRPAARHRGQNRLARRLFGNRATSDTRTPATSVSQSTSTFAGKSAPTFDSQVPTTTLSEASVASVGQDPPKSGRKGGLSVGGAAVWFALAYGGAILGYLAVNAFAARLLDEDFGYFVIAVTISTVLGQLGLMGVHRAGLREAARLDTDDADGLRELRRGVRAVSLVMLPATSVATGAVTFAVNGGADTGTRWAIAVGMAVLVWLSGQQKLYANYLRGFGKVRFASLLEGRSGGALASVCQSFLVGGVLFLFPGWGLPGAIGAMAVGFAIPVTIAWRQVARMWGHVEPTGPVFGDLWLVITRHWRFASNQLGGYLNSTVELWLAGLVLTNLDISLFSASQRMSILLSVPLTSLGVVFSPVVSRLFGVDNPRLEKLLRTGATFAGGVTAVVWIPMLVLPGTLLAVVYGDKFSAGAPILLFLTIGSLSNVISGMCGTALTMSHHESIVATVQWIAVVARVGLGVLAASLFGAVGLGASAALVTTLLYLTLWLLTRQRMGLSTHLTLRPNLRLMRQTAG